MTAGLFTSRDRDMDGAAPRFSATGLIAAAIVIGGLYLSQEVLVPVIFAVILSFVLAIPVGALQKLRLGRKFPVAIVVFLTFAGLASIGSIVANQTADLAGELPRYRSTIREKLVSLREATGGGGAFDRLIDMGQDLQKEISKESDKPKLSQREPDQEKPVKVEVTQAPPPPMKTLANIVLPVLKPLATTGLIIVFTIFMLLQRSDLRDRAIRLAGSHDLNRTTAAMNDAARRLSKYFLMQVLLNGSFGVFVGIGLWLIGIPSPVLWGILAAISKFIPYFGVVIAAGGPLLLGAAVDPTWTTFLATFSFFAISEFLLGQVIEPLVYGHSTGLSPVAVLLSVTFWTWLWGPVGLILAMPLTVCLVVLGRHVERLEFLDVLLGDRPPLTIPETLYQRALAGDSSEVIDQAEEFLDRHRLPTFYDEVVADTLALAQRDLDRGSLTEQRLDRVASTMDSLIEDLDEHRDPDPGDTDLTTDIGFASDEDEDALNIADRYSGQLPVIDPATLGEWGSEAPVLCIGSRTELDRVAAAMLAQIISKQGLATRVESAHALTAAGAARIDRPDARIVCLSTLDTSTPVHLRYAVRRIRKRLPDAVIVVGCWGLEYHAAEKLRDATQADFGIGRFTDAAKFCLDKALKATTAAPDDQTAGTSSEPVDGEGVPGSSTSQSSPALASA